MDLSSSSTDEHPELRCASSELPVYTVHHNIYIVPHKKQPNIFHQNMSMHYPILMIFN